MYPLDDVVRDDSPRDCDLAVTERIIVVDDELVSETATMPFRIRD